MGQQDDDRYSVRRRSRSGAARDDDDDSYDRRRSRGRQRESPSTGRILAGVGICVGAAVLFVVGMIILVNAVRKKSDDPPKVNDDERTLTINDALRHVKEGNLSDLQKAAKALANMNVDDQRRREVVAALKGAIDNRQRQVPHNELFEAFAKWATADDVPYLLILMDDVDGNFKVKAMHVLGKLKDARAVAPLAQRLHDNSFRPIASQALKDMGPVAERAVADLLDNPDTGLRIEACRILKVIGTQASHAPLIKLAWDDNAGLAQAAREALPPEQRPPIYGMAQTLYLNIHVPDVARWPATEKKLRGLCDGTPVMCKYHRSGEYMSVRLAPVTVDPAVFATRIDFGKVGAIHKDQRLIYIEKVK